MVSTVTGMHPPAQEIARLQDLFAKQQSAFHCHSMPSAASRIDQLRALKVALIHHQDAIIHAVNEDFSCRAKDETLITEIMMTVQSLNYMIKNIHRWMRPSRRRVSLLFTPSSNQVIYQPLGVVGIMVPWNYPIQLAIVPLATAIAAGNRAMIKMSEFTPATNSVIKKLLADVFDEESVAVIEGEVEVSSAFSETPWNHLIFTGSTAVGKHVMSAAAKNLTPVTLELGGKSPAIIAPGADLHDAVDRICFGKSVNAGQTCISPDYVLLPKGAEKEFIDKYRQAFTQMYPSLRDNSSYTAIINDRQYERLAGWLLEAEDKGAKITQINPAHEDFAGTRKMPPHIIEEGTDSMTIMQEELFGPILPIVPYQSLDDAIHYINNRERPLALYLFSGDKVQQEHVLKQTHSGGVSINDTLMHIAQDDMPFGGIGPSGMGHYHGKEGFLTLSKAKSVHRKGRFNIGKIIYPPYGTAWHKLIYKIFIR
ncbi:coniferyl aldehyde dehydrogenase [Marinomonas sp. M1K-6]|uniref:Aldehyde dehydrogenase n=1 Tax=Marinomonas profundi TaxID=2726122 RepID=A0A847R3V6_9GAMM|nr:coniferyl aldehyde dehydrogenase [Marinomonas profundi]NLQ17073.1 coniferyl aldehyde dehydrogenase [Marinomonas profundi]UDV04727.1 coniferyl aldehyde dehydrogenase [Marinomonas profundi]